MTLVQRNMRLQSLVPPLPLFRGIQSLGLATESRGQTETHRVRKKTFTFPFPRPPISLSHRNSPHLPTFPIPFSDSDRWINVNSNSEWGSTEP